MKPDNEMRGYHVSRLRSTFTAWLCVSAWLVYPIFIFFREHRYDQLTSVGLLLLTTIELWANQYGSDRALLTATRLLQSSIFVVFCIRVTIIWSELLECPGQSPGATGLDCDMINSTNVKMTEDHALMRALVTSYHVFVVLPVVFMLHLIPVRIFMLPVFVLGCIDIGIASTYVSLSKLATGVLSPLFSGIFLCIIGHRKEFLALIAWQEVKRKEVWLAGVAHNIGTPLMTISFAASAMRDMTDIENIRAMLKRQNIAVEYLRSVYTSVMYRRDGRTPVVKRQRFKIAALQQACEAVTSTYGSSLFPDVAIKYALDQNLPDFIVGDWAKIQQCVVNLVSNAQKHCHGIIGDDDTAVGSGVKKLNNTSKLVIVKFGMDSGHDAMRIEVCDNGVGVKTSRVKSYFSRDGTGLGSVGMIVASMGGTCGGHKNAETGASSSEESASSCGSTFFITVPLRDDVELDVVHDDHHASLPMFVQVEEQNDIPKVGHTKTLAAKESEDKQDGNELELEFLGPIKVLLVEDVSVNRALIRMWLLREFPFLHIVDASNGKDALQQLQRAEDDEQPFQIVLMDISMPVMDGFTCLDEMNKMYGDHMPTTIAISTGIHLENPTRRRGEGPNFDQCWDKTDESALLCGMKSLVQSITSNGQSLGVM